MRVAPIAHEREDPPKHPTPPAMLHQTWRILLRQPPYEENETSHTPLCRDTSTRSTYTRSHTVGNTRGKLQQRSATQQSLRAMDRQHWTAQMHCGPRNRIPSMKPQRAVDNCDDRCRCDNRNTTGLFSNRGDGLAVSVKHYGVMLARPHQDNTNSRLR